MWCRIWNSNHHSLRRNCNNGVLIITVVFDCNPDHHQGIKKERKKLIISMAIHHKGTQDPFLRNVDLQSYTVHNRSQYTPVHNHLNVKWFKIVSPFNNCIISRLTQNISSHEKSKRNTLEKVYWEYKPQSRNSVQQKWIHVWSLTHVITGTPAISN